MTLVDMARLRAGLDAWSKRGATLRDQLKHEPTAGKRRPKPGDDDYWRGIAIDETWIGPDDDAA